MHCYKIFPGEQVLELIDPAPINNCVISRQKPFEQAFVEMKQVAVKYDVNTSCTKDIVETKHMSE